MCTAGKIDQHSHPEKAINKRWAGGEPLGVALKVPGALEEMLEDWWCTVGTVSLRPFPSARIDQPKQRPAVLVQLEAAGRRLVLEVDHHHTLLRLVGNKVVAAVSQIVAAVSQVVAAVPRIVDRSIQA